MIAPIIEELRRPPEPSDLFNALNVRPYCFFLDSSAASEKLGRFSFLGCDPFLVFKSKKEDIALEWKSGATERFRSNPFTALKRIFKRYDFFKGSVMTPFSSGGVGYFSYDLKDFLEKLPDKASDDLYLPDCAIGFYDAVVAYDNFTQKAYIASSGLPEEDHEKNRARAESRLEELKKMFPAPSLRKSGDFSLCKTPRILSNFSKASYMEAVRKAKSYIKKGDIYQVNLSQRFRAPLDIPPGVLYARLRQASPAPFSAYLDFKDTAILSSSPERFLMKRGRYIETRPIKGTRPRGADALNDLMLENELIASSKDRAEHVMIVDLERNDLGRICEYGSVRPSESFALERYADIFHLVSTVSGKLKRDIDPIDCLTATFPGGSITGAPKIRSMEIIEELEPVKRSVYTGAIGYISFDGNMDTSIVIRTFVIKGRDVYFQVGGGIVADSDPEQEYEETLHKAKGLMRAIGAESENRDFAMA